MNPVADLSGRKLLFADDHPDQRQQAVLALQQAGIEVFACSSGVELQRVLAASTPTFDAVITDLWDMGTAEERFIPERDLPPLIQRYAPLPFIIYSAVDHEAQQYEAAGVRAFVLKADTMRCLLLALQQVLLEGREMYYSPSVELKYQLSRRELQVLRLHADGLTAASIAGRLGVTEAAIDRTKQRIFAKLELYDQVGETESPPMNITRAVALAVREGLVRPT